ncbi:hypothetical protein BDF20DRAFT_258827 [Mycotypha africana]|uniref:uncharacterized protein n=1 Tax=Mycotypha africana TaxID=64632 RepID=UPI002300F798|nr:uncharacterized protein BDF20DRAFT_258827 [Mycotypha africana]KAI8987346.1 hypothetical protein BDF20DRAFT_258827 [Mycotypha africana]
MCLSGLDCRTGAMAQSLIRYTYDTIAAWMVMLIVAFVLTSVMRLMVAIAVMKMYNMAAVLFRTVLHKHVVRVGSDALTSLSLNIKRRRENHRKVNMEHLKAVIHILLFYIFFFSLHLQKTKQEPLQKASSHVYNSCSYYKILSMVYSILT